jgi:hypothetical protein
MATTDFLTKQRRQIKTRLEELRPLYEEYLTLERAQDALDQLEAPIRRVVRGRRGPGRPPGSKNRKAKRGPGRPPGSKSRTSTRGRSTARKSSTRRSTRRTTARRRSTGTTRADQTLATIKANPGIGIGDLAKRLGIRPNYLYRVTAQLQKERKIRRRNGGFHPA